MDLLAPFKSGVGIDPSLGARGGSWGGDKWFCKEERGRGPEQIYRQESTEKEEQPW